MEKNELYAQLIQTVLPIFLFTILFLYILKKLINTFRKGTTDPIDFHSVSKLLSLGLTFLILSTKVNNLFLYIFNLIVSSFKYFSYFLSTRVGGDNYNFGISFNNMHLLFIDLIIIFAVWLFIYIFLNHIFQSSTSTSSLKIFSGNLLAKNTFVVFLLIFSIYLCVATIVAIPEFQALESSEFHNEELTEFTKEVDQHTGSVKENFLLKELSHSDLKLKNSIEVYNELNYRITNYNQIINTLWEDQELRKREAVDAYKSAVLEKTATRELIKYRSLLKNWVRYRSISFTSFIYFKPRFENISRGIMTNVTKIEKDTTLSRRNDAVNDSVYEFSNDLLNDWDQNIIDLEEQLFSVKYMNYSIPDKPEIGEQYGVFRFMSGWLLRTESMSLALIAGLFAFGLLGSIGSTFIRHRIKTGIDSDIKDFIPNLPAVLINGISSAIVVFLAVKGSLIIFSGNDSEVNPYILFFTCLVAAVYSEDVWKWAQDKLAKQLTIDEDTAQQVGTVLQQGRNEPEQGGTVPQQGSSKTQQVSNEPQQDDTVPEQGNSELQQGGADPQQDSNEPQQSSIDPKQQDITQQGINTPQQESNAPRQGNNDSLKDKKD